MKRIEILDGSIHFYAENGEEIVTWNEDEVNEDPVAVFYALAGSLKMFYEQGAKALMEKIRTALEMLILDRI